MDSMRRLLVHPGTRVLGFVVCGLVLGWHTLEAHADPGVATGRLLLAWLATVGVLALLSRFERADAERRRD
jgi:uncharacterized membrane protein YbjE (DUF340 family)